MKKLLQLLLIGFSITVSSQEKFWDSVRFGGGLGLDFGNNSTTIAISPTAIYDFNEQFSAGLGVGYQYSQRRDFKANVYSASALALYNPFNRFQLSTEFEQLFINQKLNTQTYNTNIPALYFGIAYTLGRSVSVGARYDVLYDKNKSIYSSPISPIVRVFF